MRTIPSRTAAVRRCLLAAGLVAGAVAGSAVPVPARAHGGPTIVHPGESIQEALDHADRGGDRIVVRPGTYAEQLTITTDGIDLVGQGAVLVPPPVFSPNTCTGLAGGGTEAGICVTGTGVELAPFVVEHSKVVEVADRVRDVSITGFEVRGASGPDIAIVGAAHTLVAHNRLVDGAQYGVLAAGSRGTRISDNVVSSSPDSLGFIGICVDDWSPVQVIANDVSGSNIGLCIQTNGANVRENTVHGTCIGIYVDPGITGAEVRSNEVGPAGATCGDDHIYGMFGIIIGGAHRAVVRDNRISGQHGDEDTAAVGIAVLDGGPTGPFATGNRVTGNVLTDNDLDLLVDTAGTGNRVTRNDCSSSEPAGLCP